MDKETPQQRKLFIVYIVCMKIDRQSIKTPNYLPSFCKYLITFRYRRIFSEITKNYLNIKCLDTEKLYCHFFNGNALKSKCLVFLPS